tara:strand:- start:863 stop:1078 length:216 start_codon:yes stop_codon:yes gene_type:complete
MNKTATLDLTSQVNILAIDSERRMALVMDEDGGETEVSLDRLDNIEEAVLDLSPLEQNSEVTALDLSPLLW